MGKFEKKKTKKTRKGLLLAVILIIAAILLALFVMPQVLYRLNGESSHEYIAQNTVSQGANEEMPIDSDTGNGGKEATNVVEFPAVLDEGRIEIESLFSFSGVNPDAQKQKADDVASIVLKNISNSYLSEATVTATLADGTQRVFSVQDLPAGASVMAFSVDNAKLLSSDLCTDIAVEAVFEEAPGSVGAECAVDGMMVTVTNTASKALQNVSVYYRDVFDGKYFGGKTYCYNIENLSAGESTTFAAEESLLGVIEVVRIAANQEN